MHARLEVPISHFALLSLINNVPESCVDNSEDNSVSCDWFCGKVIKPVSVGLWLNQCLYT